MVGSHWSGRGTGGGKGRRGSGDDFAHDLSEELAQQLRNRPFDQGSAVFDSSCDFDTWPTGKVQVLVGPDDRVVPEAFQRQLCKERLGLEPTVIAGGHAIALSRPLAVARWLRDLADETDT